MGNSRHSRTAYSATLLAGVCALPLYAHAQNATWLANPPNGNFNDNNNWTPATVPTGTATFGASTQTSVGAAVPTTVGGFTLNAGAPTYGFGGFTFNGAGIVNNSSNAPVFSGAVTFAGPSSAANARLDDSAPVFRGTSTGATSQFISGALSKISFFDSSTAGSMKIDVLLFANVAFHDNSNAGNASIRVIRSTLEFHDNSSAGNSTILFSSPPSGGQFFLFGEQSTAGNATIENGGASRLGFGGTSNAGTAKITNFGDLGFGLASSAANASIVNHASLQFNTTATAANATITMVGSFANAVFLDSSTGGQARFILNDNAVINISALGAAGMTLGSVEGLGKVFLGSKNLTIGTNNLSTVFDGVFVDGGTGIGTGTVGGSLTKVGTGTLTLNGANTYTGPTTINGGTLAVNGSIVSPVTVNSGGTLGGTGTVGSTTVNSGGVLSPGNSIGAITVNGNLILGAGAIFHVEVSPTDADRVNVTGTASLGGTAELVFAPGSYTSHAYTILSAAGGRLGNFNAMTTSGLPPTLTASLVYTPTDVLLVTLTSNMAGILAGNSPNQKAVAAAQDAAFNNGKPAIFALYNLPLAQLPGALDQLSGEVHPSTTSVLLDESLYARSAVLGRLRQASYGGDSSMASLGVGGPQAFADGEELSALAYGKSPIVTKAPPMSPRPSYDVTFWAQGFGAWGRFDSDGNAAAVRRDLAGFFTGADTRVGSNGRLGIAAGYTGSRNNLDGRGGANVESGHLAGYGGWNFGALNLRGGGAFAWHTIDSSRTVFFPGFFDTDTAHYNGTTGQIFGELGYGFAFGKVAVEPFAGAAWVNVKTDGFNERGGAAALAVAANSFNAGYSTLGIRAASMIPLSADMVLVPRASLAWQHAFDSVTPAGTLAFQSAAVPFTIAGVPIARDAALAEAGLDLAIGRHATVGVSYTGQLAGNVHDHAAKGKFAWKF